MFYSKSKSTSRWPEQSVHAKSGIACVRDDGAVYSIHKHLDLSHLINSVEKNEEEEANLQEEIKESICSNEGESHDTAQLEQVLEETDPLEQEVESLKNQVFNLQETKQELERQLLLYDEQKEQDFITLNELQSVVEAKTILIEILGRKIESLEGENCRLEGLAAERAMLKGEMQLARMKMKEAQSKVRKSWGKKKEIMVKLRQQIAAQRAREAEMSSTKAEMKKIIDDLHGEIEELKRTNSELLKDKGELMKKMDSIIQGMATEKEAAEKAIEEANRLRIANVELSKKNEMYRNDRRTDIEELIYLRWINACLKYELQKRYKPKEKNSSMNRKKGERIVVELGLDEKKSTGYDSDFSSTSEAEMVEPTVDVGTERRTKKSTPKFLHKVKGWVNNNERTKKTRDEDRCRNSADEKGKVRTSRAHANALLLCGEVDCVTDMRMITRSRNFPLKTALC